ncbi:hypothetical protein Anas_04575, partial [Armadillidium nasatum]
MMKIVGLPSRFTIESLQPKTGEMDMISLTTLGRMKTPRTGELKLSLKARRVFEYEVEAPHFSNTLEIRLVTEFFPEFGRLNAKLTNNEDEFSLSTRVWSGPKSLSLESYGILREESLKSSVSVTLINPTTSWQIIEAGLKADHLGELPFNFESSFEFIAAKRHEKLCSLVSLAQLTPSTAAFDFKLVTYFHQTTGTQIFLKWTSNALQSAIVLLDLKTVLEIKLGNQGRKLDALYSFSFPRTYLNDIDSTFNFNLEKGNYYIIPEVLLLKGRMSINRIHHWILDIDHKLKEMQISAKGAIIRPENPVSFSIEFYDIHGETYHFKVDLVLDANSHHITMALTPLNPGKELTVLTKSSLLPESNGYVLRIWKRGDSFYEFGIIFTEGSKLPLWTHIYRLRIEIKISKYKLLEEVRLDDYYLFRINETDQVSKRFIEMTLKAEENNE